MICASTWGLLALSSILSVAYASSSSQSGTATCSKAPTPSKCPQEMHVPNGGFENGKISPWYIYNDLGPSTPSATPSIIKPGFKNSKYAFKVHFPSITFDNGLVDHYNWNLATQTVGEACYGYYYNITYSWNFPNFPTNGPNCLFQLFNNISLSQPIHFATEKAGWRTESYIARNIQEADYFTPSPILVDFGVYCYNHNGSTVGAFDLLVDNIQVKPVAKVPKFGLYPCAPSLGPD